MKKSSLKSKRKKGRPAYSYIRFSSYKQEEGDSVRRQVRLAEEHARREGYDLKETRLADLNVSGYTAANLRKKSALGGFLGALGEGKIEPNAVLIIEDLDRLSRAKPTTAITVFFRILSGGVQIDTLIDNQRYTEESVNQRDLVNSVYKILGAHVFSERLSHRMGESWGENKRWARRGIKSTERCPFWLALDKTKGAPVKDDNGEVVKKKNGEEVREGEFLLRKEKDGEVKWAPLVQRIFKEAAEGIPASRIAAKLNEEGIRTVTNTYWTDANIYKLLKRRSVLGYYQPCKRIQVEMNDEITIRFVPDGDEITDFYPAIVDISTWRKVKSRVNGGPRAKGVRRVRVGARCSNLFAGFIFDAEHSTEQDKYRVVFDSKPTNGELVGRRGLNRDSKTGLFRKGKVVKVDKSRLVPADYRYLVSQAPVRPEVEEDGKRKTSRRELKRLPRFTWKYSDFEKLFLAYVERIDWDSLADKRGDKQTSLDKEIEKLELNVSGEEEVLDTAKKGWQEALRKKKPPALIKMYEETAEKAAVKVEELNKELNKKREKKSELLSRQGAKEEVVKLLSDKNDERLIDTRLKLRSELQRVIKQVGLKWNDDGRPHGFEVHFHDGTVQAVIPVDSWNENEGEYMRVLGGKQEKSVFGKKSRELKETKLAYVFTLKKGETMAGRVAAYE